VLHCVATRHTVSQRDGQRDGLRLQQERFRTLTSSYYRGAHGVILGADRHAHAHTHTRAHARAHARPPARTHARTHTHTHAHTRTHTRVRACVPHTHSHTDTLRRCVARVPDVSSLRSESRNISRFYFSRFIISLIRVGSHCSFFIGSWVSSSANDVTEGDYVYPSHRLLSF
jgi:hypothetical protein